MGTKVCYSLISMSIIILLGWRTYREGGTQTNARTSQLVDRTVKINVKNIHYLIVNQQLNVLSSNAQ